MIGTAAVGRVDGAGALLVGDARIHALHVGAGGRPGGALAVPGIAAVARLARRLQVAVTRPVLAADGERVLDLWVHAAPDGDGVRLEISGWAERPAAPRRPRFEPPSAADVPRTAAGWRWAVDQSLIVTELSPLPSGAPSGLSEHAVGRPLAGVLSLKEDGDGSLPMLAAVAARERFDGQLAAVRDGSDALYRLSGVPVIDGDGRFVGFKGVAVEAGERNPPPASNDAESSLDAALREPLTRILRAAESLGAAPGAITPQYGGYAVDIASAGRHLLELVDDLVDLSAIERPDFRPDSEPVDLADAARRAAGLLRVRAAEKAVTIEGPGSGEGVLARGDFRRILQILVNLLGNALRYSPAGAVVRLGVERNGTARLVVSDQGLGVAAEDQARIFERFERVDASEPGGTGLGLTISRRLARAMGGDVTVESAPGQGARFTLELPVA